MFANLSAPAGEEKEKGQYWEFKRCRGSGQTYYRLGKKRPGSGILSRYSRSALMLKATAETPIIKAPMIAVFAFQLPG